MSKSIFQLIRFYSRCSAVVLVILGLSSAAMASSDEDGDFRIESAKWEAGDNELRVKGKRDRYRDVTVTNADTGDHVGTNTGNDDEWKVRRYYSDTSSVPCRIRAEQEGGEVKERDVKNTPGDCDDGSGGNTPPVADANGPYTGTAGSPVNFDGSGSADSDGNIVSWDWDFGDGNTGSGQTTTYTYASNGNYPVTLTVTDDDGATDSDNTTADISEDGGGTVPPPPDIELDVPQTGFKIMMNYELGMHCTGFEFAYCCVLPAYNSILAQVVKPQKSSGSSGYGEYGEYGSSSTNFATLLEGDPNQNLDILDRQTVLRDKSLDSSGNFKKYVLKYWHDAQPRNNFINGQLVGKVQNSTLISDVENNSLLAWNTVVDAGMNADGSLNYGDYNGAKSALKGDGSLDQANDNYQNAVWNHLYIFADPNHPTPAGVNLEGHPDSNWLSPADENTKFRLGVNLPAYPVNCGPAYHPMGPGAPDDPNNPSPGNNDCGGLAKGSLLTYSGERGTIVFSQMKLVENLPIMLTSPGIWEALGLPLTPFEDTIDFFADPGLVDEDSIRPYVAMKARLYEYDAGAPGGVGSAVFDANGPVTGFGTAPIDIPNCERCHAAPPDDGAGNPNVNSPSYDFPGRYNDGGVTAAALWAVTQQEYDYWVTLFPSMQTKADWYARLKSAAINMLTLHDLQHGTGFTDCYPESDPVGCTPINSTLPQNTRMGHESVICQKCHADNVIAVVKSACMTADCGPLPTGDLIKPVTEAIHWNHRNISEGGTIAQHDALNRSGGCQGCHPAHRSDGDMSGYPITIEGDNFYANSDNRLANGGCFVGRDVHSNPMKDIDGAETPEHLNAVGAWLKVNVARNQAGLAGSDVDTRGLWCTNCHTQLSQEIWKAEDCADLINGDCDHDVRGPETTDPNDLINVVTAINEALGTSYDLDQAISWLDPRTNGASADGVDRTHEIWDSTTEDALVAVIEVDPAQSGAPGDVEIPGDVIFQPGHDDALPKVNILSFCTTETCLDDINDGDRNWEYKVLDLVQNDSRTVIGAAVPFGAATDGRDHWLSPGEPHCGDCHAAPYTEQSGNIDANPPFNYPKKASLMRYSKGHQGITCQGCHESIHGLYPVTPDIDTTTYAQAASLNHDGSHGPLKCGTCHEVGSNGTPQWHKDNNDGPFKFGSLDNAIGWAHTFTEEAGVLGSVCQNCHGDERHEISDHEEGWLEHTMKGRVSRTTMDKAEAEVGRISDTTDGSDGVCRGCHGNEAYEVDCNDREWKEHLTEGRVSEAVWVKVSQIREGSTCGW